VGDSKPGNANLPIGVVRNLGNSVRPIGEKKDANQEIGVPRGVPGYVPTVAPTWHSRGYMPHFESSEATQHVTFHLADSLAQSILLRFESELKMLPAEKRELERRRRAEAWIDAGHGSCILRKPRIADIVQGSLLTFDAQRYRLLAWVVMPNHVHVLFEPMDGWTVAKIVASWKKFTARRIGDYLRDEGETGTAEEKNANREIGVPRRPIWHREYWDRYIRNEGHLRRAVEYIHMNPVKAGLASSPQCWRWSSAFPGNADVPSSEKKNANQEIGVPRKIASWED
jgi:REP element-mobilizing transposase RayT